MWFDHTSVIIWLGLQAGVNGKLKGTFGGDRNFWAMIAHNFWAYRPKLRVIYSELFNKIKAYGLDRLQIMWILRQWTVSNFFLSPIFSQFTIGWGDGSVFSHFPFFYPTNIFKNSKHLWFGNLRNFADFFYYLIFVFEKITGWWWSVFTTDLLMI